MNFIFPYIGNVIIPTDKLILFRGVGIPPTRYIYIRIYKLYMGFMNYELYNLYLWIIIYKGWIWDVHKLGWRQKGFSMFWYVFWPPIRAYPVLKVIFSNRNGDFQGQLALAVWPESVVFGCGSTSWLCPYILMLNICPEHSDWPEGWWPFQMGIMAS